MDHTHFPMAGAVLHLKNKQTGKSEHGLVMRSEPERGFVIVLNENTFETFKLDLQRA